MDFPSIQWLIYLAMGWGLILVRKLRPPCCRAPACLLQPLASSAIVESVNVTKDLMEAKISKNK